MSNSLTSHEILIHIGLETVHLEGKGFTSFVTEGEQVSKGTVLLRFDLDFIKNNAKSTVTPVIFIDSKNIKVTRFGNTKLGEGGIIEVDKELVKE